MALTDYCDSGCVWWWCVIRVRWRADDEREDGGADERHLHGQAARRMGQALLAVAQAALRWAGGQARAPHTYKHTPPSMPPACSSSVRSVVLTCVCDRVWCVAAWLTNFQGRLTQLEEWASNPGDIPRVGELAVGAGAGRVA